MTRMLRDRLEGDGEVDKGGDRRDEELQGKFVVQSVDESMQLHPYQILR
jgi:hypothetical protein